MSSTNSDSFTFLEYFTSFSCLIAVARSFNIMLNKSSKSGQTCLTSEIRGNTSRFSVLRVMLAVGFSYM